MKIRNDFVTNSSSSSFIIAYREDITKEDIVKALMKEESSIKTNMNDYYEEDLSFEDLIQSLATSLYSNKNYGMNLGSWNVYSQEYTNEDGIEDYIVYSCLDSVDTEKFKIKGV